MKTNIESLNPQSLWKNFKAICQIPHPSGHTAKIADFIVDFGQRAKLETKRDNVGNVLIKKPATPGMENMKTVILQAHMDMVPQKNSQTEHDFTTDPIQPYIDGEWVTACDTTLGADNGIGLASILSVLESNELKHGPIEALFTVDEETGMFGAIGLSSDFLTGDILINTDSEEEGELYVGCAGGLNMDISFRYKDDEEMWEDDAAIKLSLTGLKGGHSGIDIILGRANANKLMFRFLKYAVQEYQARLSWVSGGNLRNAIPREAFAIVTIPDEWKNDFIAEVAEFEEIYRHEYLNIEDSIHFTAEEVEMPATLIPEPIQDDLINAIVACQNGVDRTLAGMPAVVESSSNLAVVKAEDGAINITILVRSASETLKSALASSLESAFQLAGAKVEYSGAYPGWEPNFKSPILKLMSDVYEKLYGKKPKTEVIHAGLECGIIGASYPRLDMISFGPTLRHPHSPDEKVKIETVDRFWNFLVTTLENIPQR